MREVNAHLRKIFRSPEKRRVWILYQLQINGESYVTLGERLGIKPYCFYRCLAHPYPKIEAVLAKEMEVTPQVLFPERYDIDGLPNRPKSRYRSGKCYQPNKSNNREARNTQREKAI